MTDALPPEEYIDRKMVDPAGDRIGSVGQVYLNDRTGEPDWITVNTGFIGMKERFVPLAGSSVSDGKLLVPFVKDAVKQSPEIADSSHLDREEQQALYAHYEQHLGGTAAARAEPQIEAAGGASDAER